MATKKKGGATAPAQANASVSNDAPASLLRKISPRTVIAEKIGTLAPKEGAPAVDLLKVFGVATGTKTGETQYGEWTALTGMFEAVRVSDGARFQGGACFLPGAAGEMLIGALRASKEKDPDASVHFAVMIGVKGITKRDGTAGYEFTTREIVKVQQADALADLRAKALEYDAD